MNNETSKPFIKWFKLIHRQVAMLAEFDYINLEW